VTRRENIIAVGNSGEDGILAQIAKGDILQTETCFGWNDKHDNDGSGRHR